MSTAIKTKYYYLALFFLLISFCVHAQQENASSNVSKKEIFAFGPKLSLNITNECLRGNNKSDFCSGADLGLFFRFSPGRLYIQPEVNYHIRNTKFGEFKVKDETHHLDIPILIGVKVIDLKIFKLRLFAGPEFNMKFKGNMEEYFYQLGIIAGLGVDIWRFTLDANYSILGYIHPSHKKHNHSNIIKIGVGFKCF